MSSIRMEIPNSTFSFNSFAEYGSFENSLELDNTFQQTEVAVPYSSVGLEEKWYKNINNGECWRLVRPDPPFGGIWSKVV